MMKEEIYLPQAGKKEVNMSTKAKQIFLFFGILIGLITACLGLETCHSNHLGWALLFAGAGFTSIGCLSLGVLSAQASEGQSRTDQSLWLPCFSALIISLITPLEYLYMPSVLPRSDHVQDVGLILFAGGLAFYLVSLQSKNPWRPLKPGLVRKRFPLLSTILCPIPASLLLFGLGLCIGFSSAIGLLLILILLFPSLLYRMGIPNQWNHS